MISFFYRTLKESGHPGYKDIEVDFDNIHNEYEDLFNTSQSSPETESSDDPDEGETEKDNNVTRHQYKTSQGTCLTDNSPEARVQFSKAREEGEEGRTVNDSTPIAPGEGKCPTNLMRSTDWDVSSFPCLHPSGRYGLHHPRAFPLTPQQYFVARILSSDGRWRQNLAYLYSAVYYVERAALERSAGICCRRGKISNGRLTQFEDVFHVFRFHHFLFSRFFNTLTDRKLYKITTTVLHILWMYL